MLFLYLLSCSEEEKPQEELTYEQIVEKKGGVLFQLSLDSGENIVGIYENQNGQRISNLFLVESYKGLFFLQNDQRSETFSTLIDIFEIPNNEKSSYLAIVKNQESYMQLIYIYDGQFTQSEAFENIHSPVSYNDNLYAFVGTKESKERVIFFNKGFDYTPFHSYIKGLRPTPDNVEIEFKCEKKLWGVGKKTYQSQPVWRELNGIYLYTAKNDKVFDLVISYKEVDSFNKMNHTIGYNEDKQLLMTVTKNDGMYVNSISNINTLQYTSNGPYKKIISNRGKPSFHSTTGKPQMVVSIDETIVVNEKEKTVQKNKLLFEQSVNNWHESSSYKKVVLKQDMLAKEPVAIAYSDTGQLVLRGANISPEVAMVQKLQSAYKNEKTLFLGKNQDNSFTVFINEEGTGKYISVRNLSKTKTGEKPYYIATIKTSDEVPKKKEIVVLETTSSKETNSVVKILPRKEDAIVWHARIDDGEIVGMDTKFGETFEKISSFRLTPIETLLYDATVGESKYRVIETTKSRAFHSLSPVTFSRNSLNIIYSGRTKDKPEDGLGIFTDYVVVNTEEYSSYKNPTSSPTEERNWNSGKFRPSITTIYNSDSFYYTATQENKTYVALDKERWGGYDTVNSIKLFPNQVKLAYAAKVGDKWSVYQNGEGGEKVDQVLRLRFTLDNKFVRYEAKKEKTSYSFLDKDRYLKIAEEKLNKNKDIFTFQGYKDSGASIYVNYKGSKEYDSFLKTNFTTDGYGIEVVAKKNGKEQLIQLLHNEDYEEHELFSRVKKTTHYYLPYNTVSYLMPDKSEEPNTFRLSERPKWNSEPTLLDVTAKNEPVFLAIGNSTSSVKGAWLIEKIENNVITLRNGPSNSQLKKMLASKWTNVFILPLKVPFSYGATDIIKKLTVYNHETYEKFTNQEFTNNRRFTAFGTDEDGTRLIIDKQRTKAYPSVEKYLNFHPSQNTEDWVAFKTFTKNENNKYLSQFVITNQSAETTDLGYSISVTSPQWTPLSRLNEHTLVYEGYTGNMVGFQAVGQNKHTRVREVGISPNGHLYYIARDANMERFYHKGEFGDGYYDIPQYKITGSDDTLSYVGKHYFGSSVNSDQVIIGVEGQKMNGRTTSFKVSDSLVQLVIGKEKSSWFDDITDISYSSDLMSTHFLGTKNHQKAFYKGETALSATYDDITFFQFDSEDNSYHFLGKKEKGWEEVHNGKVSFSFETLLPPPSIANYGNCWESSSDDIDTNQLNVIQNCDGSYLYKILKNDEEAIVYRGKEIQSYYSIPNVWFFEKDESLPSGNQDNELLVLLREDKQNKKQIVMDNTNSEEFDHFHSLKYQSDDGKVYSLVSNNIPVKFEDVVVQFVPKFFDESEESEVLKTILSEKNISKLKSKEISDEFRTELINDGLVLNNTKMSLLVDNKTILTENKIVPVRNDKNLPIYLASGEKSKVYHSGAQSNSFDHLLNGGQDAFWGESLEKSRFVIKNNEQETYEVFSNQSLLGPFSGIPSIGWFQLNGEDFYKVEVTDRYEHKVFKNTEEIVSSLSVNNIRSYNEKFLFNMDVSNVDVDIYENTIYSRFVPITKNYYDESFINQNGEPFPLIMKEREAQLSFLYASSESNGFDLAWGLVSTKNESEIKYSWFSSTLNYETAKIDVLYNTLDIPIQSKPLTIEPLQPGSDKDIDDGPKSVSRK